MRALASADKTYQLAVRQPASTFSLRGSSLSQLARRESGEGPVTDRYRTFAEIE
jgi:hypothetical protein